MQETQPSAIIGLREIARSLSNTLELEATLDLIVRETTAVLRVDSCSLYLLEEDGVTLRLSATTGLRRQVLGYGTLQLGEGMTGAAVQHNRPIYAAVAREHPDFKLVDAERERELMSLLAVPLTIAERPIGAINVQTRDAHTFTPDEIEMLLLIGDLAAGALVKAQLFDEQKMQIEDLRALAEVSEAVTSPQYLDDMLDIVTDMAARSMNVAVCALFMLDESAEYLELRAAQRRSALYQNRRPIPVGRGVIGRVMASGNTVYIPEIAQEPGYVNPTLAAEDGLVSMLAVPLSVRERVIGVMACYTQVRRKFTDDEVAFISTMANQTALAIENAHLVTNAAITREMHHRIKNNLQMVAMLMQLQLPDADKLDTREVLETNMHRIRSIATVHDVLSEKGYRLVDVKDVLERIAQATVEAVNAPFRQVGITVSGESVSLPSQTATALALVVNELVQNAVEHAFVGRSKGHIYVSMVRQADTIKVWVRDDGVGLPDVYEHGLGLEIATTLVADDLNGEIVFKRVDPGTEVMLVLQMGGREMVGG